MARYLSAFNFAMWTSKDPDRRLPCKNRTLAWYQKKHKAKHTTRDNSFFYFLAHNPYSLVFNVTSESDVPRFGAYLESNFVVGVTDRMEEYLYMLTSVFKLDERASTAYNKTQHFSHSYDGHVLEHYCRSGQIDEPVRAWMLDEIGTDTQIYEETSRVAERQLRLAASELPVHTNASASCHKDKKSKKHHDTNKTTVR